MLIEKSKKQEGIATLFVAITIVLLATIITVITARFVMNDQQMFRNSFYAAEAHNAAMAGFDYALGYLNKNVMAYSTITDGQTLSGTLPNNAKYTTTYTFNTDVNQMTLTSKGDASNGTSTKTVKAVVKRYMPGSAQLWPIVTQGKVILENHAHVHNKFITTACTDGYTIRAGGAITIKNNANTNMAPTVGQCSIKGNDCPANKGPDLDCNNNSLSTMSDTYFQTTYLGLLITDFSQYAQINQPYSTDTTFTSATSSSDANNWAGKVVYLDMNNGAGTATFEGNFYAGTTDQPTLIVVNGSAHLGGSGTNVSFLNGSVYATGTVIIDAGATATGFAVGMKKNAALKVDYAVNISNQTVMSGALGGSDGVRVFNQGGIDFTPLSDINKMRIQPYGVVPGSWRDF